jgi:WD40 repeat protein
LSFSFFPCWSPDSQQIAYSAMPPDKPAHLYSISKDGGTPRLLYTSKDNVIRPSWAHDGNAIAFAEGPAPEDSVIRWLDLKTLNVTTLPESKGAALPTLSPDGRYLAAINVDSQKLRIFNVSTQEWTELLQTNVGYIVWSADGKYIYFDRGLVKDPAISRLRIADRKVERIADLKDFRREVYIGVPWMGLTPEGAPLLMRDTGTQEVYALDFVAP